MYHIIYNCTSQIQLLSFSLLLVNTINNKYINKYRLKSVRVITRRTSADTNKAEKHRSSYFQRKTFYRHELFASTRDWCVSNSLLLLIFLLSFQTYWIYIKYTYWRVYASANYSELCIVPGKKTVRDRYHIEATIRKEWSFALWCITFILCDLWTELCIKIVWYI